MLSERERRILADIEARLSVHDPRFVARMRSRRRRRVTVLPLILLGAGGLSAAFVLAALWNVTGAITVTTGGVITVLAGVAWRRYRR